MPKLPQVVGFAIELRHAPSDAWGEDFIHTLSCLRMRQKGATDQRRLRLCQRVKRHFYMAAGGEREEGERDGAALGEMKRADDQRV